jgi:pimeloyl-ACP methyl ester carboxylesterase
MTGDQQATRSPGRVVESTVVSTDGTPISVLTVGDAGPGVIVVGGVLSKATNYLPLAQLLADEFQVHVMNRRGRPGSGPMLSGHTIEEECADLTSVAAATGARAVFGHSFGGLIALEVARRSRTFASVVVYDAALSRRNSLRLDWLDGYAERLASGDRRGAFGWMVQHNGFSPRPISMLPAPALNLLLQVGLRGDRWDSIDQLLDPNLIEHMILKSSDDGTAARFASVVASTCLLVGERSPAPFRAAVDELKCFIPSATAIVVAKAGHTAPQHRPRALASTTRAALHKGGD